jgi:hypothetical protein
MVRAASAALALTLFAQAAPAFADGRCLEVTNVPAENYLYIRSRASARARVLDRLPPRPTGAIRLDGQCTPTSVPWERRWCPIVYRDGERTISGWVKAQWAKEVDCPD